MVEISSLEFAMSKLNWEKEKKRKIKSDKETNYKIYYHNEETGKTDTLIRSKYDLERTRDIHKNIISMYII